MSQPSKYVLEHFDFNCDDEQKHNLRRVDESDEFRETLKNDERRKVALLEHWRQFHRIDHLGAYSIIIPLIEDNRPFFVCRVYEPTGEKKHSKYYFRPELKIVRRSFG